MNRRVLRLSYPMRTFLPGTVIGMFLLVTLVIRRVLAIQTAQL